MSCAIQMLFIIPYFHELQEIKKLLQENKIKLFTTPFMDEFLGLYLKFVGLDYDLQNSGPILIILLMML